MLMLLEAVIIAQAVTSLVTEGKFCIQPEYKQAVVFLVKKCEILHQKPKLPFGSSVGKGDNCWESWGTFGDFCNVETDADHSILTDALAAWVEDLWCV